MLRIVAVIPARGGSKGIPRKNIRELAGKPLIAYTVVKSKTLKRVTVSPKTISFLKRVSLYNKAKTIYHKFKP